MAMPVEDRGPAPGHTRAGAASGSADDLGPLVGALVVALEDALLVAQRLLVSMQAGREDPRATADPTVLVAADCACRAPTGAAKAHEARGVWRGLAAPATLSRREAEVLGLLAAGRSNRDVAQRLCLSPHTVQRHVANVYLKIGAHCRAEATAYALRRGLC